MAVNKFIADTVTKNAVQFFNMKTAQYSKNTVSCSRKGDLEHFFDPENHVYLPCLREHESLQPAEKKSRHYWMRFPRRFYPPECRSKHQHKNI